MDEIENYENFLRNRITELRLLKNVSEHRMSLSLGKSGSYIRGITNGSTLPSLRELFNIITYFDMTPEEFFTGADDESPRTAIWKKLLVFDEEDLKKIELFINWIQK
ncbi:helix-turn-helix transcriptional regulator [Clostridium sp. AM58-1XD]|uniref:helix-turn-helix domain-containing protein n=1 Tax=Clostridium sp. AM58-1XD TaxID=2292307 RepID=UPI000E46EB41|nr:helix-turn-helix transcriptional regulator [Clostridium sp. AM58-1XD]RGY99438.1 XRE family transcriptional regulator [Clostridium sp. AM58-1XD]